MVGARLSALVALMLLLGLSTRIAYAQEGCKEEVLGLSSRLGMKQQGGVMVDHTSLSSKGPITRVSLYYSKEQGCLKAAKLAFGNPPVPGVIGNTAGTTEKPLKLEAGEVINRAEYKAGKCIEYIKLTTNKGRSVSAGRVGPVADVMSSAPTDGKGQLLAIKGSSKAVQGKKQGALQHLQLVWGSTNCMSASAPEGTLMAESGTLISEDAGAAAAGACKPRLDMCNEKASMNAFTYCVWNAPFSGSACRGGCCFSSGKCASSSCAISGMGRDVANMICYGANNGVGFGGNSNCVGLACKLATPGCTTDAFGGNCVGTVAPFGPKDAISAESLKFIGAPCLDATPSDTTLDAAGAPASGEEGIYMGKLWTICDCTEGGTGLPEPAARLLNLTTTRISNFTKNEVLAAFSTLLPQKNVTDEAALEGKSKVVTLLPSFADMFKLPALSSISLPNLIGSLSGPKGAAKNASLPLPKLPDLSGLLTQIKPPQAAEEQSAATQPALNFESGSLPNGTAAASDMVETPGFAPEKPVRTLGSLFSRFTKPKEESNSDGSSTFTPGSTEADQSASTKVRPMTLGALLGGLRRAGPDNSTTAPTPAAAHAGNSTKKLDLSPIGALITKFINGPPPPAQPAAATTTAAPAVSANAAAASPAANGSVPAAAQAPAAPSPSQPAPAAASPVSSQPANTPASTGQASPRSTGPAALDAGPKGKVVVTPAAAPPAPTEPAAPAASPEPGAALSDPNYIPGDPKNRPLTLAERLRAKKLADKAAKAAGNNADSPSSSSTAPPAADEPAPVRAVRKSGFSANVDLPHIPRPWEEPVTFGGIELGALMNTIGYLTQLLSDRGAGANPDDIAQVTALLTQLQQLPGGLASLPPDVSQALMVLAAEMSRVTAEQSAGQTPAEAPSTANAPAAAPSTADSAKQPAQPTEPSAQPVTAAVASQPSTAEPAAVASAAQPEPAAAVTTAAVPAAAAATTAAEPAGAASAANSPAQPAATVTTAAVPAAVATAAKPTAAADTTVAKPAAAATVTTAAQPAATVATASMPTAVTAAAKPAAAATVATAAQPAVAVAAAAKPKAAEATAEKPAAAATVATAAQPAATVATASMPTAVTAAAKPAAAATMATAAQPAAAATAAAKPEAAAVAAVKTAANPVTAAVTKWHSQPQQLQSQQQRQMQPSHH